LHEREQRRYDDDGYERKEFALVAVRKDVGPSKKP